MEYERYLSAKVQSLQPSGIRRFFDILNEMKGAISLSVGEPDFQTPWHIREAAIFAAFSVDGEAFGYPTVFASDEAFAAFLEQAREKSAFQADVQVTRGDRLLILSTCAYSYETERLLVVAKIIE